MQEGKTIEVAGRKAGLITRSFLCMIRFYQVRISPLKAPTCRFFPTCSQYMYDAVKKHGFLRGGFASVKRVLRCHPFNPGGYDPVD